MPYKKRKLPIGKTFNQLTIIKEIPSPYPNRRYIYCSCTCGSKTVVRYDGLKSGSVKSCGCLRSKKSEAQIEKAKVTKRKTEVCKAEEYIGKQYNRLKVLSLANVDKPGRWFNVRCDCGRELTVSLTRMKIGHTKSCGCINRRKGFFEFVSEIDGEVLLVSKSEHKYRQTLKTDNMKSRESVHTYEAKKAFILLGIKWDNCFRVHHIDSDKLNNSLDNLHIFQNPQNHKQHHCDTEKQMRQFITRHNMLDLFYKENPKLKLETLRAKLDLDNGNQRSRPAQT